MCLDDSHEVAALPKPVVIIETDGIRVEFRDSAHRETAVLLLINECIKHGKPVASFDEFIRRESSERSLLETVGVWRVRWSDEEELSQEQKERRVFAHTVKEKFK